jgi:hypothetical protein
LSKQSTFIPKKKRICNQHVFSQKVILLLLEESELRQDTGIKLTKTGNVVDTVVVTVVVDVDIIRQEQAIDSSAEAILGM